MLMPILRLVLIYVALILAVMAVFNRDKLGRLVFGDPEPQRAATSTPAPTPAPIAPSPAPAAPTASAPAPVQSAQVQPAPMQPAAPSAPSQPVVDQYPPASFEPGQPMPAPQAAPQPGMLQTPTATPPAPAPQPAAPRTALEDRPEPALPIDMPPAIATALNDARNAYWAGDADTAESLLQQLVAANPDNPDLHGELGNLRFTRRNHAGAADAYMQAADLLIAQGRRSQAAALVPVMSQIDPDKALALATRLQTR